MATFVDPNAVLASCGLATGCTVADFGCGAGFYTIPAARIVKDSGVVYAIDVQDSKLSVTLSTARQQSCRNVFVFKADLEKPFQEIEESSCDLVVLASILHQVQSRESLLHNAYRLLKTGGTLLVVEWKKEATPVGPDYDQRLSEAEIASELAQYGFKKEKDIPADSYHYAMAFNK